VRILICHLPDERLHVRATPRPANDGPFVSWTLFWTAGIIFSLNGCSQQPVPHGPEESRAQSGSTPAIFSLDATSAAKQMAALNATSIHRRTSQSGGTSDSLFGLRQPQFDTCVDCSGRYRFCLTGLHVQSRCCHRFRSA
jgi:hypothetical protein